MVLVWENTLLFLNLTGNIFIFTGYNFIPILFGTFKLIQQRDPSPIPERVGERMLVPKCPARRSRHGGRSTDVKPQENEKSYTIKIFYNIPTKGNIDIVRRQQYNIESISVIYVLHVT